MPIRTSPCFLVFVFYAALAASLLGTVGACTAEPVQFDVGEVLLETGSGTHTLSVEIARTPRQRERGLMFRRALADDAGMLFLFERDGFISMWMKNTYVPLDMIFIDRHGRVTQVVERTTPGSQAIITSAEALRAVLEVKAGTAARLAVRPGSLVRHKAFGNADGEEKE
jgi:uncharacterized membrane protein (UPF0127 family)